MVVVTPIEGLGIVGLVLLFGAFAANSLGRLPASRSSYQALNFVGSGLLAVYAYFTQAWIFFPLEVAWALVAAGTLASRKWTKPPAAA
jgi:hypothetical protein